MNPAPSFSSSEFLSAICHELKTPLNAIIGFSEALKEDIAKDTLKNLPPISKNH